MLFPSPSLILAILVASIPTAVSLWALLDAAKRPAWAWSLAGRSQLAWIAAQAFGLLTVVPGLFVATFYLLRIRKRVAAAEQGDLRFVADPPSSL